MRSVWLFLALTGLLSLSSCATLHRISEAPTSPQVLGGTRTHITSFPYGHAVGWFKDHGYHGAIYVAPWVVVDLPLSLVADIVLLPYSATLALTTTETYLARLEEDLSEVRSYGTYGSRWRAEILERFVTSSRRALDEGQRGEARRVATEGLVKAKEFLTEVRVERRKTPGGDS